MQPLEEVRRLAPKGAAVFASRMAALKLAPLGVRFSGGVVDADEDRAARERIEAIGRELAELPARVANREDRAEIARRLENERAGLQTVVGRELGVFVCPRKGTVTLSPGVDVDAEHVLEFLRGHRLCEAGPTDGETFWEAA